MNVIKIKFCPVRWSWRSNKSFSLVETPIYLVHFYFESSREKQGLLFSRYMFQWNRSRSTQLFVYRHFTAWSCARLSLLEFEQLLVQCVMRRRTGTSAPSALPVQLMAAKNLLSTNRKWHFPSLFLSHQWPLFKGLFDIFAPELNTILSVGNIT